MARDIFDIAKWFTDKNDGEISLKKMQKLCYYAQAWHLALYDQTMFRGDFQAWVHGPVNKHLWDMFKDISYRDIKSSDFNEKQLTLEKPTKKEIGFLERVWVTYGNYTGYQLEQLTHQEKPWTEQRYGLGPYENSSRIINTDTMKNYYRELMISEQNT